MDLPDSMNRKVGTLLLVPWSNANKTTIALISVLIYIIVSFLWRRLIARIRRKRLQFTRDKIQAQKTSWYKTSASLLFYFQLDQDVCKMFDDVEFESLGEYMASLRSDTPMSFEAGGFEFCVEIVLKFGWFMHPMRS